MPTAALISIRDRCLNGDQSAMLELVRQFHGQVFGLCLRMLGHRQDAEDAAQETFVRALRSLASWDDQRDFEPWLLAIAGNRCRTMLSARGRRFRGEALIEEALPDPRSATIAVGDWAEEIERGLATLRGEHRLAFELFHHRELSYQEIGEIMDCPVGTVKTWVHRARKELMAWLRRREIEEDSQHALRRI